MFGMLRVSSRTLVPLVPTLSLTSTSTPFSTTPTPPTSPPAADELSTLGLESLPPSTDIHTVLDAAASAARVANARVRALEKMREAADLARVRKEGSAALSAWAAAEAKAAAARGRAHAEKVAARSAIFVQLREARRAAKKAEETERKEIQEQMDADKEAKYAARSAQRKHDLQALLARLDAESKAWASPAAAEDFVDQKLRFLTAHDGLFPFEIEEVKARRAARSASMGARGRNFAAPRRRGGGNDTNPRARSNARGPPPGVSHAAHQKNLRRKQREIQQQMSQNRRQQQQHKSQPSRSPKRSSPDA